MIKVILMRISKKTGEIVSTSEHEFSRLEECIKFILKLDSALSKEKVRLKYIIEELD